MSYTKVCQVSDVPEGKPTRAKVAGREVAIFNLEGSFYCLADSCPHMDGPLSEGWIEGETVICPWHAWAINIKTGEVEFEPSLQTASYPCRVVDGELQVEI